MSDDNPYQSPAAEPTRHAPRPIQWLKVVRSVAYNLLAGAGLLLLWYAAFVDWDIWLLLVALALLFFINSNADVLKLRPAEAKTYTFLSVEGAIWIFGFVGIVTLVYFFQPAEQNRIQTVAIICWVTAFLTIRDGLYAAGVLPRTTEPPTMSS